MSTAVLDYDTRRAGRSAAALTSVVDARRAQPRERSARVCTTEPSRGVRLTRRGRLVILLLSVIAAFVAFTVASDPAVSTADKHHPTAEKVIVEPGQSLWDIATTIAPEQDPRDVISEIVELNALESSGAIQAGQPLFIPRY